MLTHLGWQQTEQDMSRLLKEMLEHFSHEELVRQTCLCVGRRQVGAGWYEHSDMRRGYRSGRRLRRVVTRWGTVELEIPKIRKGGFVPSVLRRYEQYREDVEKLVREMFLSGVSTRQIGPIVWRLTGSGMSASTVSRIVRELDGMVREYKSRELRDEYVYLLLDGVSQRVRTSVGVKRRVVLCAIGIRGDGTKEVISYREAQARECCYVGGIFEGHE